MRFHLPLPLDAPKYIPEFLRNRWGCSESFCWAQAPLNQDTQVRRPATLKVTPPKKCAMCVCTRFSLFNSSSVLCIVAVFFASSCSDGGNYKWNIFRSPFKVKSELFPRNACVYNHVNLQRAIQSVICDVQLLILHYFCHSLRIKDTFTVSK